MVALLLPWFFGFWEWFARSSLLEWF
uniref:Uncharacterized protein n=1 Tax=Rhizophora mucronata TaxID=61149 RepID=A0A2P2PZD0_RHIMU